MAEADGVAGELTRRAIALADDVFPASMKEGLPDDIGVPMALLARCVSIAKTSLHLAELNTQLDAYVCLRTLYEHTVMLAWILGPRGEGRGKERARRLLVWERYCDEQTLKLDREMAGRDGVSGIPPETRSDIEDAAAVDLGVQRFPTLVDRAIQADQEWDGRIRAIDPDRELLLSLRDFYTRLYRPASAMAHPTLASVQFVTTRLFGGSEIHLERHQPGLPVLAAVPVLLAMGYLATAHFVGEPSLDRVAVLVRTLQEH
jgi:hypothetical protein